jgi:hypothetical protein
MGSCCSKRNIKIQQPIPIETHHKSSLSNDRISIENPQSVINSQSQHDLEAASRSVSRRGSSKLITSVHSPISDSLESFSSYLDISCKIQLGPRIRPLPPLPKLDFNKVKRIEPVVDDDVINRRKLAFQQQKKNRNLSIASPNHQAACAPSNDLRHVKSETPAKFLALPKASIGISKPNNSLTLSFADTSNSQRSMQSDKLGQFISNSMILSPLPTPTRHRNLLDRMRDKQVVPELMINSKPSGNLLQSSRVPNLTLDSSMKWEAGSEINSTRNMNLLSPQSTASLPSISVRNPPDRRISNCSTSTTLSPKNEHRLGLNPGKRRNLLELKPIQSARISSRIEDTILSETCSQISNRDIKRTKFIKKSKAHDGFKCVNQYKLKEELGKGSFGRVVKATTENGNIYAIKIYSRRSLRSKWIAKGKTALDLMSSEADIMSRLDHPHIIKLHEVIDSTSSNKIYLIMDYASKGSLADLIPLTEQLARRYFKQLMSGLTYLHKVARVAHKDIKPDNLLIDSDDRLRIGDFGSSQNLVEGMMEVSGSVSTYAFMAPELVRGDPNISGEAVDVWASGVTLYYLIVGKLPFHTKKLQQLYEAIKTQEVSFPESMSKECVSLLTGMLEKDPAVRFKVEDIVRCDWVKS